MGAEGPRMPSPPKELTRTQFGRVAAKYRCSADHTDVEDLDLLFAGLALEPAHRVLDVATGGGAPAAGPPRPMAPGGAAGPPRRTGAATAWRSGSSSSPAPVLPSCRPLLSGRPTPSRNGWRGPAAPRRCNGGSKRCSSPPSPWRGGGS